jgi:hypothetical protein
METAAEGSVMENTFDNGDPQKPIPQKPIPQKPIQQKPVATAAETQDSSLESKSVCSLRGESDSESEKDIGLHRSLSENRVVIQKSPVPIFRATALHGSKRQKVAAAARGPVAMATGEETFDARLTSPPSEWIEAIKVEMGKHENGRSCRCL